ncbi:hypothetical protein [Candidatus Tokpelaia sp.]|uniref:hypothetical protein n=1 Tax=Candidatus Tokpelaia sp. TaxID=2233777 RepID=UPI0012391526|nr:hypothetical protein [Candidatus Tokpelaia sp.]KAA6405916.1 hypothetical protein DPQ22_02275 [Candidatus Tokpelaia sp.]
MNGDSHNFLGPVSGVITIAIGVIGGLFGAYFSKRDSKIEYILSAIFGGIITFCLNPMLILMISRKTGIAEDDLLNTASGTGFIIGLFSFTIASRLYDWAVGVIERRIKDRVGE